MSSRPKQFMAALSFCLLAGIVAAADPAASEPDGGRPHFAPNILIVTTMQEIEQWLSLPAAARGGDAGRLRRLTPGMRAFAPILVNGAAAESTPLSADFEYLAPTGAVIMSAKRCCASVRGNPRLPGMVILNPVPELTLKSSDPRGTYVVRTTVTDGARSWITSETFVLEDAPGTVTQRPAAPATLPPDTSPQAATAKAYPISPGDARHCLQYFDDMAISRCAERYR